MVSITIPGSVTSIGDYAFFMEGYRGKLSRAYFLGTNAVTFGQYIFGNAQSDFKIYYQSGKAGFSATTAGYPCEEFDSAATFPLTYDGNGNETGSAPAGATVNASGYVTVSDNTGSLVKGGYQFRGWCTSADGLTGTTYAPGSVLVMGNEPVTLYAVWDQVFTIGKSVTPGGTIAAYYNGTEIDHLLNSDYDGNTTAYVSIALTPAPGCKYIKNSLKYNDGAADYIIDNSTDENIMFDFQMPKASIVLSAEFAPAFDIDISSLTGGSITANPNPAAEGETVNLTISPDSGMILKAGTLKYNDGTDHLITGGSFVMPAADVAVSAEFEKGSSGPIGGGGGSPSSETPTVTTSTAGNVTTATVSLTGATFGGVTVASVDGDTIKTLIADTASAEKSGGKAIIGITVGAHSGESSAAVTIPYASFGSIAGGTNAALRIATGLGSITFDAAAVDGISGAATGNVTFTTSKADASALPDSVRQAVGSHPVYTFSVTSGGSTISQFGGTVTVSVPYTPAAGEDLNAIVIYYINAKGELETVANGHYDAATGTVVFTTTHFSTYAVGYNKVGFSDVSDTSWYADAVTFLAARGVTSGTTATSFSPDATLTRGQFITMLLRAYGISADANPTDNFSDAGNTYYTGYMAAAKRLGITTGVGDNRFAPEQTTTRQEMFTLLYNALKVLNQLPSGTSGKTLADFSDASDIASWAKEAMTLLVETGTVSGNAGKLSPAAATTRAEMANVLYSLLRK
jgi:uncharacterized repeat protein (TIGR02543 family)